MKVRILSGNETGAVKDLPTIEAQAAIDTGFAESYTEPARVEPVVVTKPKKPGPPEE